MAVKQMDTPRHYRVKKLAASLLSSAACCPGIAPIAQRWRRRMLTYSFVSPRNYVAQWGQDQFADQVLFRETMGGTFVDIGANDGVSCSNTNFLEKFRGWTGLCVEPQPSVFAALEAARKAVCVQGCAGVAAGEAEFTQVEGHANLLSGRADQFPPGHAERIASEVRRHGGAVVTLRVPMFEINELIARHGPGRIDLLSVDTEGGEFELIAALDMDRFEVRSIFVEDNCHDGTLERHLAGRGYELVGVFGSDLAFVRKGALG